MLTVLDPANQFAFSADLGLDKLLRYDFDKAQGKLTPGEPSSIAARPGAGPRHFTFHPNGKYAYLINELNSTLVTFAYDKGVLNELQTVSTLPEGFY